MIKVVRRLNESLQNGDRLVGTGEQRARQNLCKTYTIIHGSNIIVWAWVGRSLVVRDSFLLLLPQHIEAPEVRASSKSYFQSYPFSCGEEGFWMLCQLLHEYLRQGCQDFISRYTRENDSLVSVYSFGIPCEIFGCTTYGDALITKSTNLRLLRKVDMTD